jgi:AraC-like DNA-binding protein
MESWEKVLAVQRMQEYIEEHLTEPLTLKMLADVACYSPWHAERIFKELTGKSPFAYIRTRRLAQAALKLQATENPKIIDVAFDFVFASHEGFTRAFSREFGVSPRRFAQKKGDSNLKLFMPSRLRDYYLTLQRGVEQMSKSANVNTVFVQVVDRPTRKVILKRGIKATHYFEYCEEVGCEIWEILSGIKEALYEPIGMWLPEKFRKPGTSEYAQGVEVPVDFAGNVPEGFEVMELPPCQMMVFQGPPFADDQFEQAIGDLWAVMKSYNPEIYGFSWADEDGPRFQLSPLGYRGYMEARPVRQLITKGKSCQDY